ncbi:dienelactone hydrolase family protein (plasmid) [Pseudonocardia bannensis]|uniref:Dienelactone hydrolase family protein n=1 Tax=Pseudonocardia bannensis TaxID=630973 RepID=A0A848DPV9_9PSEU|nr:dienelactone hydrolase family protein [Pseudonocardia bannensis]NMH94354.1 dienelactone hydrolase family protein [Pseudonocardia bannensis]
MAIRHLHDRSEVVAETWTVPTADGGMGVHVRRPEGDGPFPVVVFFHHGPGLDDGSREAMNRIAAAGHLVVAPDRYHREGSWITFDTAELLSGGPDSEPMRRCLALITGTTDDMVETDLRALLDRLGDEPSARHEPMGCVGYCVGARSVVRSMAGHPDVLTAGAMLHPSFCVEPEPGSPHLAVPQLSGELYVAIGGADHMASAEANRPLIEAVAELGERGLVEIHDGADHGFAVPGPSYHEAAGERSYQRVLSLFARALV